MEIQDIRVRVYAIVREHIEHATDAPLNDNSILANTPFALSVEDFRPLWHSLRDTFPKLPLPLPKGMSAFSAKAHSELARRLGTPGAIIDFVTTHYGPHLIEEPVPA